MVCNGFYTDLVVYFLFCYLVLGCIVDQLFLFLCGVLYCLAAVALKILGDRNFSSMVKGFVKELGLCFIIGVPILVSVYGTWYTFIPLKRFIKFTCRMIIQWDCGFSLV